MERLDIIVASTYNISRSFAAKLIKNGGVYVDKGKILLPKKKVSEDASIHINEALLQEERIPEHIIPESGDLDIIYEDENVLIINKQAGMSVHTSPSERKGTLLNILVARYADLSKQDSARPGIVHRLDKDTSGILIVAKNLTTEAYLAKQFKDRTVKKLYSLIVSGSIDQDVTVEKPIARNKKDRKKMGVYADGREAITMFHLLRRYMRDKKHIYSLLQAYPKTGRTHQIRVHTKSIGHPIVGDKIYNGEQNSNLLLQASALEIDIPNKGRMQFEIPLPDSFDVFLSTLSILPDEKN